MVSVHVLWKSLYVAQIQGDKFLACSKIRGWAIIISIMGAAGESYANWLCFRASRLLSLWRFTYSRRFRSRSMVRSA